MKFIFISFIILLTISGSAWVNAANKITDSHKVIVGAHQLNPVKANIG